MYNVLLVDDEAIALDLMRETIDWEKLGLCVKDTAVNGYQAYNKVVVGDFDIIVSDIKMPIMTGLEMAKKIRELNKRVEIIFISSYEEFEYAKRAIDLGAISYTLKPVDNNELIEKLKIAVQRLKHTVPVEPAPPPVEEHTEKDMKSLLIVEEIKEYIETHLTEKINLKSIAEHFFYSPNYVGQLFKKETGMFVNDYVTYVKMQKAAQLLKVPQNHISDVAFQLGYNNIAYFTKLFKDFHGFTPKAYRNRENRR